MIKKTWRKPEVRSIVAGSAEAGNKVGDDANVNTTKS